MENVKQHMLDGTASDVVELYTSLPDLAAQSHFGEFDDDTVIVDTETTGLSYTKDELIQVAAARVRGGKIANWYITFVNPGLPIPDDITHLTGIRQADVEGAPTPQQALADLSDFVGTSNLVAHNAAFDKNFVTRHPEGYPMLQNLWIDSLDLARIALPRLRSHRLIDLVRAFGAPVSTHRADDDVAATCAVFRILLAAVACMPDPLLSEIASMAPRDDWNTGFVFGRLLEMKNEGSICTIDTIKQNRRSLRNVSRETRDIDVKESNKGQLEVSSSNSQNEAMIQNSISNTTESDSNQTHKVLLSLHALRRRRVTNLESRQARCDAENLAGQIAPPDSSEVQEAFGPDGVMGSIYESYESRPQQIQMAQAINAAFSESRNLVVEAGTGVGKSMAYLVPAALLARKNGISVGVATKTNSLLDQLVFKELPALAEGLRQTDPQADPLTWAALKGMSHYPCLRKVQRAVEQGPGYREFKGQQFHQAPALAALLSYIDQTEFDDLDSLKIDHRALPRFLITTTSRECLRRKCPYFGKLCFAHGARRRAESADILVTNHTLLFCDLAAEGGLLPTARHWVIDEAHATESEARGAFAQTVDSEAVMALASRASGQHSVFSRAERSLSTNDAGQLTLFFGLTAKARLAGDAFAKAAGDYTARLKDLLYFDPVHRSKKGSSYETVDIWLNAEVRKSHVFSDVALEALDMVQLADKLIKAASDLVAYLEGVDEAAVAQREVASFAIELREVRNAAELVFQQAPETFAYQATINRKRDRLNDRVQALLLDVGDRMNETLFAQTHSVVFASATLTVGGQFDSFKQSVGLNRTEVSQADELQVDSCFDFDNNMIVYVVEDMPEPNDPRYPDALNKLLVKAHRAQKGSMLTLFTNRREMERSHDFVAAALKTDGLRVVCQKYGVSVKGLRDDFLADEHLSLFALKSFWEGFDAPGATLKGVVIPKLPFARPTDPLYCERAARDDRAWWRYVLPQAVIETKQAAGRLIRKADDRGVLILADKRLLTKSYGKTFLGSLQSKTVRVCTTDEIIRALAVMGEW